MEKFKSVDDYLLSQPEWAEELKALRSLVLGCDLKETLKWSVPTYTWNGKNIVGLASFKTHVAIWFFQGALLQDKAGKLVNAQEGKTKALRQWRFNDVSEIDGDLIRAYIAEAIVNQQMGKEIKPAKSKPLVIPELLQQALTDSKELNTRFELLNLTRKREFTDYISEAKREETQIKRLEKSIPLILEGKGLHDKYRK